MCLQYVNFSLQKWDGIGGKEGRKKKKTIVDKRKKKEFYSKSIVWRKIENKGGIIRVEEIKKKSAGLIASNKYRSAFSIATRWLRDSLRNATTVVVLFHREKKLSSFPYIASLLVCYSLKGTPWILIDVTEIESPFFFRRYCRIATYVGTTRGSKICNRI